MGSHQFAHIDGEPATQTTGYLSPGHNSVWRDPGTGRYFLIYHQRYANSGEMHTIRTSELFINEDGWLISAPFRYAGNDARAFKAGELSGTWKIINHGRANNTQVILSKNYQFMPEGKIITADDPTPGQEAGLWELGADGKTAHITLDGVLYKGVFLRCWDDDNKMWVQAFTALSDDGIALWGAGLAWPPIP
jgi:arabinan endo-1,5-alpha-L-arabinosidase